MNKKKEFLSGFVFSIILISASLMSLRCLPQTLAEIETPAVTDLLQGKWTPQFEKAFSEALPVNAVRRDLWGRTEYALFHQGRKGVIVGSREWLFTDEEFSCPTDYKQNLTDNLLYIFKTKQALADKNVRLLVTLVPGKAHLFPEYLGTKALPPCHAGLYAAIRTALIKKGVAPTDLLSAMQTTAIRNRLYLKTDTHTPGKQYRQSC